MNIEVHLISLILLSQGEVNSHSYLHHLTMAVTITICEHGILAPGAAGTGSPPVLIFWLRMWLPVFWFFRLRVQS